MLYTASDWDETMDRRRFVRRLFAMGAGFAAGGALAHSLEVFGTPPALNVAQSDLNELLKRLYSDYAAVAFARNTPLVDSLKQSRPRSLFEPPPKVIVWGGQSTRWGIENSRGIPS